MAELFCAMRKFSCYLESSGTLQLDPCVAEVVRRSKQEPHPGTEDIPADLRQFEFNFNVYYSHEILYLQIVVFSKVTIYA